MRFRTVLIGLTTALTLLAGAVPAADRPTVTVAVNDLPDTLDPAEGLGNVHVRVVYSMFDSPIRRDFLADGSGRASKLVPGLAESWRRVDDRTVELNLRRGVKFHNGDEMTADDVIFTFSNARVLGETPVAATAKRFWSTLSHVEKVDRYRVRVVSRLPDVMLEQRLAGYASWIVNAREYLLKGKEHFMRHPVGTGPYKLAEWVDGEHIELVAHDDYFGGKPTAKAIRFVVVPEVSARIAGLVSGEYDIAVNIPPDQVPVIARYEDLALEQIVLDNTHVLVFFPEKPILQDKRVRQALSLAIDRDLLRKALWEDRNYTPNSHQLPSYEMYMADYPGFRYDPARAKALLAEAGYQGEEIVYRLPLNYYLLSLEAAQAMQQMWAAVGLDVKIEPRENWNQTLEEGVDIRPWSNTHRMPDPLGSLVPQWGPNGPVQRNKKFPQREWKAPEAFNVALRAIETETDPARRQAAYRQALDVWMDEVPGTMLYNPLETYARRKAVVWKPYSLYYMDFRPENLRFE
ncbi:MAG: ABC transporter substrate-binding protein [Ectothiorhodospiraceae bacterium]|nr:ABC transporter substrate-binding protein [Ectothiorhodospiraceae bacterium]